ncbi:hypothetical protein RBB50_005305 [Rhinocladiella similis]
MTLSIRLSLDEGKPITPGSVVLGVVKIETNEDQIIESLNIDFKGLTKVFLKQKNYSDLVSPLPDYLSKGYLFSRHQSLYNGGGIQRKGTYAWPFAFRVPLFAAPRILPSGSKDLFKSTVPWRGDLVVDKRPQPLPPSMIHTGRFLCSVHYFLEATLVQRPAETQGGKNKSTKVQTSRAIPVQSLDMAPGERALHGGDWPYVVHRRKMRCTSTGACLHTALRHIPFLPMKALGLSQEGERELCFSVLLPQKIDSGEQSPLSIPVSCSIHKSLASWSPGPASGLVGRSSESFELFFKLSLILHTQARAGCHTCASSKRIFVRQGSATMPESGPASSPTPSETETGANTPAFSVNLSDMVDLSIPSELLTADFSTYNIAQSHSFEVVLRIRYAGKKHKVFLRDVPVTVVPRSENELERQLSEGVEEDDVWGCDSVGIPWREYAARSSGTREALEALVEDYESDGDDRPKTPPPRYIA